MSDSGDRVDAQSDRIAQLVRDLEAARTAAEEAARGKREFLADMNHEIRTPLNAIVGMTELALQTRLTRLQREYLEAIQQSADALLAIVNDILDDSTMDARRPETDRVDFGLRETVEDAASGQSARALQKNLELACHIDPRAHDALTGDVARLRHAIVNLVGHAINAADRREIIVDVHQRSMTDDEVTLQFTVADQHFEETFARRDAPRDPELRDLDGLRVLVVDDHATNRQILEEMLTSWCMRPTAVESRSAVLDAIETAWDRGQPFRLLVVDARMVGLDGAALIRRIRKDPRFSRLKIVVLMSMGDGAARARAGKPDATLTKPVKHSALLEAITALFGTGAAASGQAAVNPPAPSRPLHVLVAEDNAVNRRIVEGILRKRGHVVSSVENGRLALEACDNQDAAPFDLIVMDVQMPEMDGLETTTAIRERERSTGTHVPILALTARAMADDRKRCLESGMDAYLTKPIHAGELVAVVERLGGVSPTGARPAREDRTAVVYNEATALAYTGGDRRLLSEVIGLFRANFRAQLKELRAAVDSREGPRIHRAAHALKGALATLGAERALAVSRRLEAIGSSNQVSVAPAVCVELESELDALDARLSRATKPAGRRRGARS